MSSSAPAATRLTTAELTWLLSLRPGPSATLVATALGLPEEADSSVVAGLVSDGRARERGGEVLPAGPDAVIGDVLTAATTLVRIGTSEALAALVATGRGRALLLAPSGQGAVEVAALEAATPVGEAVAQIAARVGTDAVLVARPGAGIHDVPVDETLAEAIEGLLP